jgi:hypothetical protein
VKPFSALHYELMGMYLRELASLGQKVITATVVDRPWGQGNNYEGFGSMVDVTRRKDGSWAYDYSVFDKYVAFAKECGIGPQIHCYTLAGFKCSYTDEATGERLLSLSGEAERMDYWRRFLGDFESHVKAKGWLGDVYLALDESAPSVLRSAADLLRSAAPGLKLAMAGERKPSEYAGVDIDNFSLYIGHVTPAFIAEAKARRTKGCTTATTSAAARGGRTPSSRARFARAHGRGYTPPRRGSTGCSGGRHSRGRGIRCTTAASYTGRRATPICCIQDRGRPPAGRCCATDLSLRRRYASCAWRARQRLNLSAC